MPRRRAPRVFQNRLVSAIESMIPGTVGGRVSNASPAPVTSEQLAADRGTVATGVAVGGDEFKRDRFPLTVAGVQDVTLTYLPKDASAHVYLNGIEQDEGTDYSLADQVLSILAAMGALADDVLETRYAYEAARPTLPADAVTAIFDSFDRPDETSLSTTSDGNAVWNPTVVGEMGVSSNQAYPRAYPSGLAVATIDCLSADGTLSVDLTVATNADGLVFRVQDGSNFWVVATDPGPVVHLFKVIAGAFTLVGSGSIPSQIGTPSVEFRGSSITVKWDGVTKITTTDSYLVTETHHGIGIFSSVPTARFDNWSYTP